MAEVLEKNAKCLRANGVTKLAIRAEALASQARSYLDSQEQTEEAEIGPDWQPCVKLPIKVHVREQRPGETHVSTREGITPLKPDDLIMRGVAGEEYPIGRELFEQTYRMGYTPGPKLITQRDAVAIYSEVMATHECETLGDMAEHFAHAVLARFGNCVPGEQ